MKIVAVTILALVAAMNSAQTWAGPILADNGVVYIQTSPSSLNTTPVTDPGGNPVGSIDYGDGQILLEDYAGAALTTFSPNPTWWNAPGVAYTTTTSGIEITFSNLYVTGFTFNIGANKNAQGWIRAYYDDEFGSHTLTTNWFGGIGPTKTPSYGVYVNQPDVSCALISKIEVDPQFRWGIGNFGIQEGGCAIVSAPQTTNLLSMGLLAIGFLQYFQQSRRRKTAKVTNSYNPVRLV